MFAASALAIAGVLGTPITGTSSAASSEPIVIGDYSWASAQMHNRIAGFIIEHGYGYSVEYLFGDTLPILQGMVRGDVDMTTELWPDNTREAFDDAIASGELLNLGSNYPDAPQGWYVPTYVIEGDADRGIEPMAPDLRSVEDLPEYWELFRDPEDPEKGRFHDCPAGWVCQDINRAKLQEYGLDANYTSFPTGSEAALNASIASAYRRGEPWLGYNWEPTWVIGQYDMTMLDEPAYTDECWETDFGCAYPASKVLVATSDDLAERAPEIVEFLERYDTTLEQTNQGLALMNESGGTADDAAIWFLNEYDDVWTEWVDDEVAERVKAALGEVS